MKLHSVEVSNILHRRPSPSMWMMINKNFYWIIRERFFLRIQLFPNFYGCESTIILERGYKSFTNFNMSRLQTIISSRIESFANDKIFKNWIVRINFFTKNVVLFEIIHIEGWQRKVEDFDLMKIRSFANDSFKIIQVSFTCIKLFRKNDIGLVEVCFQMIYSS